MKLFCAFAILFFSVSALAYKAEVRIAEKSTVRVGDPIRLGALIEGTIADPELNGKVQDLIVLDAITDETEKIFESEDLALVLRQKLSFQDLKRVAVKIPNQFAIRARRNFLYQNEIMREITDQALRKCMGCTVEFNDLKLPDLKVKGEILKTHLDVQALKGAGGFLLPLAVETSQGRSQHWVTGKLSFYKQAPVAKRLLNSNERISENDFEMKQVDVSFAKDGIPAAESIAGKMAARMLTVGQPIFEADLKKEPAATRGQIIKILVGDENFEVATSGTAEESGNIGDMIKVKSTETKKYFSGTLIEKGVVRVQ